MVLFFTSHFFNRLIDSLHIITFIPFHLRQRVELMILSSRWTEIIHWPNNRNNLTVVSYLCKLIGVDTLEMKTRWKIEVDDKLTIILIFHICKRDIDVKEEKWNEIMLCIKMRNNKKKVCSKLSHSKWSWIWFLPWIEANDRVRDRDERTRNSNRARENGIYGERAREKNQMNLLEFYEYMVTARVNSIVENK